eukprot:CAMPEP_0185571536 /NCGR_PEP_ID=MMETSP0434-20130131/3582_1 /TAXON_ID=626734 ORGANISM="Favella taraikaensis, Strain Fe Narragansett Bay" /NCGR_SAMPLE_ID=MMETSP0434 /ASSEMBLY_ACC=CAM_ASM_000379 /LENGTH=97 /DNA_ID=CAMNT_0028187023 /DNA_START=248 /DNA_END=541 /DNA_ORIENTATION=+
MLVEFHVTVKDFVEGLLAADLDHVIILGDHVDHAQLPRLLRELAYTQRSVLPPGQGEAAWVPRAVWDHGRDVQVASHGAMPPHKVRLGVHRAFRLLS